MKLTIQFYKHNLYRMMRNQWKSKRNRRIYVTGAVKNCEANNLEVLDANEFVKSPRPLFDFSTVVGLTPRPIPRDSNHPLFSEKPCYMYRDHSVLLEGLQQALVLTNTVELQPGTLPIQVDKIIGNIQLPNQDELVQRCIKTSVLYDAEQKKLPKRINPERPTVNLPRDYGITESRKNRMLCSRLMHLCALTSPEHNAHRTILHDAPLSVPLQWENEDVQLELRSDMFIASDKSLSPIVDPSSVEGHPLPELNVSHPLISLEEENVFELKDVYPLKEGALPSNVHTIVVHYNNSEVSNIFDTPVLKDQTLGRSLIKAYAAAVAQARYTFGLDVMDLPVPIVVQCIQTDSKAFHFSMLQLNSANVGSKRRNVYWSLPPINLYEDCSYQQAIPTLQGYNPEVFKYFLAFHMNNA